MITTRVPPGGPNNPITGALKRAILLDKKKTKQGMNNFFFGAHGARAARTWRMRQPPRRMRQPPTWRAAWGDGARRDGAAPGRAAVQQEDADEMKPL